jgi:outer membrane protein assembly factor BamB
MILRSLLSCVAATFACVAGATPPEASPFHQEELRRLKTDEANQGVAVDQEYFYAITNSAIGKYRKDTGERAGGWEGEKGGHIKHLNAGSVIDGKLYCAHSNFPDLPEQSSVEIWDTTTMKHVGEHVLDNPPGSLTWVVRHGDAWFACFAHYKKTSDPALTQVVKFDAQWKRLTNWRFPAALIEKFAGNSSSGGAFGPDGHLFVTGHDARELYVLDVPENGGELLWRGTIPISSAGQAFAWDEAEAGTLYTIERKTKEVVVSRILAGAATKSARSPGGFESLFDGKSFAGWEQKGNWVIEDGAMFRKNSGGPVTYTVKLVPDDFELRFEWKVSKGCNSGVYYRPGQYEYQVLDNANSPYGENPRQSAASLFFCMAPSKDATKPLGEWNEGRVMCQGTVIQHWLNSEKVIDFDYTDPKWAKEVELLRIRGADLAARRGKLWLQDHGAPVWFRNIRLRTIPPEEKLSRSDFTPMPVPPAALEKENERVRKMLEVKKKPQ